MLYSNVPVEPLVVADTDKEVVPPLHPIVPAMADAPVMLQGGAAIICTVEVELLSEGESPIVAGPEADPGATPVENAIVPPTVEGPPIVLPCTTIRSVRLEFGGITSVPFEKRITPPAFW